jgi:hypothetical protein
MTERGGTEACVLDGSACRAVLGSFLLFLMLVPGEAIKYRWPIKTGTDADAWRVQAEVATTICDLARQRRPHGIRTNTPRLAPVERTIWTVHGELVSCRLESDGDYHLLLRDPACDSAIVAEIPDPARMTAPSAWTVQITAARAAFRDRCNPGMLPDDNHRMPVVVTGVGFFDQRHVAEDPCANAIELHPVLGIELPPQARPTAGLGSSP